MPNTINKVVYGNSTLIDLTSDTVTPETLMLGATAHNAAGQIIVGTSSGGGNTIDIFNDTGSLIPAGSIVTAEVYSGLENFVGLTMTLAEQCSEGPYYILSNDCADGESVKCYYIPGTICSVLCDENAVSQNDLLAVSEDGQAHALPYDDNDEPIGKATIGIALEDKASGEAGEVKVKIIDNLTLQAESTSTSSTVYGTCFMVVESDDDTLKVTPSTRGKIPFGVQANSSSAAESDVLLHTHQNDEVAVMADTTEIKVGDWLVPSASTAGQVRNGSGYGVGEALTAKSSGSSGLVRVHLNLKYGYSPRDWWMVGGITEDQVLAAYQFVAMQSEADALQNVNNGTAYPLSKTTDTILWSRATGFYFPATVNIGLNNTDLVALISSFSAAAFGFSGASVDASNLAIGGIIPANSKLLEVRGVRGATTYLNYPAMTIENSATLYKAATRYDKGVLACNWSTTEMFVDGEQQSITYDAAAVYSSFLFGQPYRSSNNPVCGSFYMTAAVIYNTALTAAQHLELSNNIKALGGIGS